MTTKAKDLLITKHSGEQEYFSMTKFQKSLRNAKAPEKTIDEITHEVLHWLAEGVTTREIYAYAYRLLRNKSMKGAIRYKLKKALLELGPTGYPFERFIGEIFKKQGYEVATGQIIEGKCVKHEMDVIATKGKEQILIECKFSRDQKSRLGIQVPLYVKSRVEDIIDFQTDKKEYEGFNFITGVVTNAHLSMDSINYGTCRGLYMMGWDYPQKDSLKDLVEHYQIFPITVLSELTHKEKSTLLLQEIVSCSNLANNLEAIDQFGKTDSQRRKLLRELEAICGD